MCHFQSSDVNKIKKFFSPQVICETDIIKIEFVSRFLISKMFFWDSWKFLFENKEK